jgi:hypothetical protein
MYRIFIDAEQRSGVLASRRPYALLQRCERARRIQQQRLVLFCNESCASSATHAHGPGSRIEADSSFNPKPSSALLNVAGNLQPSCWQREQALTGLACNPIEAAHLVHAPILLSVPNQSCAEAGRSCTV